VSPKPILYRPLLKRRRCDEHGLSTSTFEYSTVTTEAFPSNITHGKDSMTNGPASSETPKRTIFSEMGSTASQPTAGNGRFNNNRTTLLEEELKKEKADHHKTKQALEGAMANILDLRKRVEKLQIVNARTSHQYDGLARNLIQIQEANLARQQPMPQRAGSNLLRNSTEVKALDHTRTSRNVGLRPLSIIHTATISEPAAAQSRSRPSSYIATTPRARFPIATSSDDRSGSNAASNRNSTIQSSSPVYTGIHAGFLLVSHTCQSRPGSAGNHMANNVNTTMKKGLQGLKQKLSHPFMSKHCREEKSNTAHSNTAQSAPALESLPTLSPSVPLQREMSNILIDGDKRDSGYASI
jgi:hypothetical protein